jgi:hypothetical protein
MKNDFVLTPWFVTQGYKILNKARIHNQKPVKWLMPQDYGLRYLYGIPVKFDRAVKHLTLEIEFN